MRFRSVIAALLLSVVGVGVASASAIPISVFTAPDKTYANTANTPCIFYGKGLSGCSHDPAGWTFAENTGNGNNPPPFTPYPLEQSYTFAQWNSVVGSTFVIGLDINQASSAQTLDVFTIDFFDSTNTLLKSYAFAPPTLVPDKANGTGYADYVLAAGCAGTTTGTGVDATCTQAVLPNGPTYSPFAAPSGTTSVVFNFGLTGFNDGPDKIFAIPTSPIGTPTQNCVTDPTLPGCEGDPVVPEPASLMLLGSGLLIGWAVRRRKR